MKLLILTCLVALAVARPMVEKASESEKMKCRFLSRDMKRGYNPNFGGNNHIEETKDPFEFNHYEDRWTHMERGGQRIWMESEYVTEFPEKHLKRRDNIPVTNEHYTEINHYLRPEYEMMNLYYQPFYWSEEMRNLKMTSLPKDRRMAALKSTVSDEVLPPFQHKFLSLPKSKVLSFSHRQILPFQTLRMVPLSHKLLTTPKQEMLPIPERESLLAHEREILLPPQREMIPEREFLLASERVVVPEQEREILPDNERKVLPVHKRETVTIPEKEKNLPLFQQRVLSLPRRDIAPHYQRDTVARREVLPVYQREFMPEVVALDLYPFFQPMPNYYYPTELNKKY